MIWAKDSFSFWCQRTCSSTGSPSCRAHMAPWKRTSFAVIALSLCIPVASAFIATSPPLPARWLDPIFSTEPAVDSEPVVPNNKVLASEVKFWTALEHVFKGGLRKRDFFRWGLAMYFSHLMFDARPSLLSRCKLVYEDILRKSRSGVAGAQVQNEEQCHDNYMWIGFKPLLCRILASNLFWFTWIS